MARVLQSIYMFKGEGGRKEGKERERLKFLHGTFIRILLIITHTPMHNIICTNMIIKKDVSLYCMGQIYGISCSFMSIDLNYEPPCGNALCTEKGNKF